MILCLVFSNDCKMCYYRDSCNTVDLNILSIAQCIKLKKNFNYIG